MIINVSELQSDMTCKDAAKSTKGITQSIVNYLRHLMTWGRFVKKLKRKVNIFKIYCVFKSIKMLSQTISSLTSTSFVSLFFYPVSILVF